MKVNIISESEYFPKGHGVHTAYLNHLAMLEKLGIAVSVNSVVRSDVTHIHTIGPLGLYKLSTSHPTIVTAHVIPKSFLGSIIGAKYWPGIAKEYLKFFYNRADLILAVSPQVKRELQKIGVTQRIEVFPNVIDKKMFQKSEPLRAEGRKRLELSSHAFVVLGVGQMQPRKGIEDFVMLAQRLPEVAFVWVGGRPFKALTARSKKMKQMLKSPPKNLRMVKAVPYARMASVYNAADVFFFPSYQENAPMVIIEAASCGLPLILRDLPEYRMLYKKGYLTGSKHSEFKKLIQKLNADTEFYKKAAQASSDLSKEFSYQRLGETLLGYYKKLLRET